MKPALFRHPLLSQFVVLGLILFVAAGFRLHSLETCEIVTVCDKTPAALQRAQLKLINNPRYEHPGFWSPFLMINNWL